MTFKAVVSGGVHRGCAGLWSTHLVLGLVALLAVSCVASTPGPVPIGPHEHFRGMVNGTKGEAIVTTACGGPVWEGRTGPAVAGQTLSVTRVDSGGGDTGTSSVVFAQPSASSMTVVAFDTYGVELEFPTNVQVPCDGTGLVIFNPCFGVVPCLGDAQADVVKVRFVNIAD